MKVENLKAGKTYTGRNGGARRITGFCGYTVEYEVAERPLTGEDGRPAGLMVGRKASCANSTFAAWVKDEMTAAEAAECKKRNAPPKKKSR